MKLILLPLLLAALLCSSPAMASHSICSDVPHQSGRQTCSSGDHPEYNALAAVVVAGIIAWTVVRVANRPKDKFSSFTVTPQFATDTKTSSYGMKFEFTF